MIAIVDTRPLYAVVDADDMEHARCVEVLEDPALDLVVPALVVAEATYLVGLRLGPAVESEFLRGLAGLEIETSLPEDWDRIGSLVETYGNFPLGGTDASVVALAERLGTDTIVTLDRRHFGAIRPRHGSALRLLP